MRVLLLLLGLLGTPLEMLAGILQDVSTRFQQGGGGALLGIGLGSVPVLVSEDGEMDYRVRWWV